MEDLIGTINAGYTIIDARECSFREGLAPGGFVLARKEVGEMERRRIKYVTWRYNAQTDSYFTGHYFEDSDLGEAAKDFEERVEIAQWDT